MGKKTISSNKAPLVSFVIPAYNAGANIDAALRSLLQQGNGSWEALVIDDGSFDDTRALANSFAQADGRIHVVTKKNGGVSSARNMGLKNAIGKYIAFLDADDTLKSDFVEMVEEAAASESDVIVLSFSKEPKGSIYRYGQFSGDSIEFLLHSLSAPGATFPCWMFVFSREMVEVSGIKFEENCHVGEDQEFTLKMLLTADSCCTARGEGIYRYWSKRGSGSAMDTLGVEQFDYVAAMQRTLAFAETISICRYTGKNTVKSLLALLQQRLVMAWLYAAEMAARNGVSVRELHRLMRETAPAEELKGVTGEGIGIINRWLLSLWDKNEKVAVFNVYMKGKTASITDGIEGIARRFIRGRK